MITLLGLMEPMLLIHSILKKITGYTDDDGEINNAEKMVPLKH